MIVEQIWTGNAYRNFNYLIACPRAARRWPSIHWTTRNASPEPGNGAGTSPRC